MKNVLPLAVLLCACSRSNAPRVDTTPAPADAPPSLTLAHEAYLAGDFVEMGERLKDVIVDPRAGELAKENAFALLEAGYDATRGKLPARTSLPPGVKSLSLGAISGAHPFDTYRTLFLDLRVVEGRAKHVTDMRVTRLPNETLLALSEKRGTLKNKPDEKGFEGIAVEVKDLATLPDRGAFAIQVTFDDAPPIDAFVLANKLVASAQPELLSPDVNESLADAHPTIAWHPFRSPEYATYESRSMWIGVSRDKTLAWDFYKWDPGELASAQITNALEADSYWISLLCMESRTFGGILMYRGSESGRPFRVVR